MHYHNPRTNKQPCFKYKPEAYHYKANNNFQNVLYTVFDNGNI